MTSQRYPLGCVILASGSAQRFGSNKLLADFNGRPLIRHILELTDNLFQQRIVVTRYEKIAALCASLHIPCLLHDKPLLNDTIRLGLEYLSPYALAGYAFCTSDQPLLQRISLELLCQAFASQPQLINRLAYNSTPGSPMIFPCSLAQELQSLPADSGGSFIAKKYPELVRLVQVQDKYELFDIDTVRDLRQCLNLAAKQYSKE